MEPLAPLLSVIICHHVGRDLLNRCLKSLAVSQGVRVQLIVVTSDPTYTNDTVELYYREDGPAGKRNLGVKYAKAETIVFLDDDVEISPYCLYEFWKFLNEHPKCGMAFAKIYKMEEGRRDEFDASGSWITWTGFLWDRAGNGIRDRGQYQLPCRILASKSAACMVRRMAFYTVGGFDRDYFILGEETDLAWRLWLRGWEVWYNPRCVSWHAFDCSTLKPKEEFYTDERIFYRGCKNYLSLLWTNLGTARLLVAFPVQVCTWLLAACGFCFTGYATRGLHIMRGLWDFTTSLPNMQRKRSRVQSSRRITDAQLWTVIAVTPRPSYYVKRLWRYWTTQLHG